MALTVTDVRNGAFQVQSTIPGTTDLGQCALIWLLLQMSNGMSQIGQVYYGSGPPKLFPANQAISAIYTDTVTNNGFYWDPATQSWK